VVDEVRVLRPLRSAADDVAVLRADRRQPAPIGWL
jgi:hypothetical protein